MREIKFRAWDTKRKHMYFAENMERGLSDFFWEHDENDPIMQYTGLKDKNGKEIYEGDIISFQENIKKVVWDEVNACFVWEEVKGWGDNFTGFYNEYEIIGNIYENPELL